jgi:hypothetical protein
MSPTPGGQIPPQKRRSGPQTPILGRYVFRYQLYARRYQVRPRTGSITLPVAGGVAPDHRRTAGRLGSPLVPASPTPSRLHDVRQRTDRVHGLDSVQADTRAIAPVSRP